MANRQFGGGNTPTDQDRRIIQQCGQENPIFTPALAGDLRSMLGALSSSIDEMRNPAGWNQGNSFNEEGETMNMHSMRIQQQMRQLAQREMQERRKVSAHDMQQLNAMLGGRAATPRQPQKQKVKPHKVQQPKPEQSLRSRYQNDATADMPLFDYAKVPAPVASTGLTDADKEFLTGLVNTVVTSLNDIKSRIDLVLDQLMVSSSRIDMPAVLESDELTTADRSVSTEAVKTEEYFIFDENEEDTDSENSGQSS